MIKIKKVLTYVLSVSLMFSILGCSSKEDNKINYNDLKKQGYEIIYTNGYKENEDIVQIYITGKKTTPRFTYEQKNDKFYYSDSAIENKAINVETENFDGEKVSNSVKSKIIESLDSNLEKINTNKDTLKKLLKKLIINKKTRKKYVDTYNNELSPTQVKNNSIYGSEGIKNSSFTPKGSSNALLDFMKSIENQGVVLINPTRNGDWVNVDLKINGVSTDNVSIKYFVKDQRIYIAKVVVSNIELFDSEETRLVYQAICKAINSSLSNEEINNCLSKLNSDGQSIIYNDTLFERDDIYSTLTVAY